MLSGISPWSLLLILLIVVLLFGTKKLGNLGSDLGKAIRGFRSGLKNDDQKQNEQEQDKTLEDSSDNQHKD